MKEKKHEKDLAEIRQLIDIFFPNTEIIEEDSNLILKNGGQLIVGESRIISYLQTALLEEHLTEIVIQNITRTFYTNIIDEEPSLEQITDGDEVIFIEKEVETGSYLKKCDYFLTSPLTPSIGNAQIRQSKTAIVKFFTGTAAIELGCFFREIHNQDGNPHLCFGYPQIGRVIRDFRLFRVKAISSVDAKVLIEGLYHDGHQIPYQIVDISSTGLGFLIPKHQPPFMEGEELTITINVEGFTRLEINSRVRRIAKLRGDDEYNYICGVQFDLDTRATAANVERLTAGVQRLHLREMAEKTAGLSGVKIIR